ncbi:hypothetical protein HPP92_026283 [Vanilla planifolia]|uniref:PA domain-containing protein n=1 Tax=Vanilla planifolia TaxID=51239 RepID=A0A835U7H7_VANPL|nr:hypothetical protein HPP92_026283 [Vanilla planifolia]
MSLDRRPTLLLPPTSSKPSPQPPSLSTSSPMTSSYPTPFTALFLFHPVPLCPRLSSISSRKSTSDPSATAAAEVLLTFHAYARSGAATGQVVYANYGRVEDFAALRSRGVEVAGNVVLARYGKIYRGDIVRNAHLAGAVAAIVYTDAKDYGGHVRPWFPDGLWLPPSGVQVGSTYRGLGDLTTPGWASIEGCERVDAEEAVASELTPAIPSLPVSSRDAEEILKTIGGQVAPADWQGADGAPLYHLGPGPGFVDLIYLGNETIMKIQNVVAVIEGRMSQIGGPKISQIAKERMEATKKHSLV